MAQDLRKVEQLESKINTELTSLRQKIDTQTEELKIYSDLDKLRSDSEARKKVRLPAVLQWLWKMLYQNISENTRNIFYTC